MSHYKASIDIGSNSTLLLVANVEGSINVAESLSRVTALGKNLDKTGSFEESSMDATLEALKEYVGICSKYSIDPSDITVTATEASRVAKNADTFYNKVKIQLGLEVTVISGEGEAFYSTLGVLIDDSINDSEVVIMDIGGASTELIRVDARDKKIQSSISMPIGSVRATNWIEDNILVEKFLNISKKFDLSKFRTNQIICVAGTMTSVSNMLLGHKDFEEKRIQGYKFTLEKLFELVNYTSQFTPDVFMSHFPFLGKRAYAIKGGLKVASFILEALEVDEIYVSTYGLRYGTLLNKIESRFISKQY